MTGPEHYREAERLLAEPVKRTELTYTVTAAQAHALLALAAATALGRHAEMPLADSSGWLTTAGAPATTAIDPADAD